MSDTPIRDRITLKFWQDAGILNTVAAAADSYYDQVQGYLSWLLGRLDEMTAPLELVDLLAWQRDIERLSTEPDELYRRRVMHALANARDAGGQAGFERIWQRLGLGGIVQEERVDADNWDVIRLRIDEYVFGKYHELFDTLIAQYGRTCRRYQFSSIAKIPMGIRPFNFSCEIFNTIAR